MQSDPQFRDARQYLEQFRSAKPLPSHLSVGGFVYEQRNKFFDAYLFEGLCDDGSSLWEVVWPATIPDGATVRHVFPTGEERTRRRWRFLGKADAQAFIDAHLMPQLAEADLAILRVVAPEEWERRQEYFRRYGRRRAPQRRAHARPKRKKAGD